MINLIFIHLDPWTGLVIRTGLECLGHNNRWPHSARARLAGDSKNNYAGCLRIWILPWKWGEASIFQSSSMFPLHCSRRETQIPWAYKHGKNQATWKSFVWEGRTLPAFSDLWPDGYGGWDTRMRNILHYGRNNMSGNLLRVDLTTAHWWLRICKGSPDEPPGYWTCLTHEDICG